MNGETNPLETDVVIIDEMSMVDMFLMNALLHAIMPGTKLILVGDVNQLPKCRPGKCIKRYYFIPLLQCCYADENFPTGGTERDYRKCT